MSGPRVLFVCVENAGRSQIAAALFRALAEDGEARSAGTNPAGAVHPHVAAALAERGLHVGEVKPRPLTVEDAEWADLVVTMGCGDACPVTGKPTEDWGLADPKQMSRQELSELIVDIEERVADLLDRLRREASTA